MLWGKKILNLWIIHQQSLLSMVNVHKAACNMNEIIIIIVKNQINK